jgi:hypothetical protein
MLSNRNMFKNAKMFDYLGIGYMLFFSKISFLPLLLFCKIKSKKDNFFNPLCGF